MITYQISKRKQIQPTKMGIRANIRDELKKETVTKIHGQPTSHDLTILEKELIAILARIPTALGGGNSLDMLESLRKQQHTQP